MTPLVKRIASEAKTWTRIARETPFAEPNLNSARRETWCVALGFALQDIDGTAAGLGAHTGAYQIGRDFVRDHWGEIE